MKNSLFLAAAIAGAFVAPPPAGAQPANLQNARVAVQPAVADFGRQVGGLAAEPAARWIGWSVAAADGRHQMCCWDSRGSWDSGDGCCGQCRLERSGTGTTGADRVGDRSDRPVLLETAPEIRVLLRADSGGVRKVRVFSADCAIDAGGMPVVWITSVSVEASVAWLESLARSQAPGAGEGSPVNSAIAAIAHHAGASAVSALLTLAKRDPSPRVRSQALFWVAQRAGSQAAAAIENAILEDPDTEVKTKAVFALTQMPDGEGVPELIHVARTNRNAEVRRKAMFWLGQSKDPRALAFFEEVLSR